MKNSSTAGPLIRTHPRSPREVLAALIAAVSAAAGLAAAAAGPAYAMPAKPAAQQARLISSAGSSSRPRAFFGLGPASKTKIDGRSYFEWSATPGSSLTDHVALVDFGTSPVTLHVFVANAVSTPHGGTNFAPSVQRKGGPAGWVTIHFPHNSPTVHLAPRSKIIVPITVVVPKNAPPGDHVGSIVAALHAVIQTKNHVKVHFIQQVAVRIIARVSGRLRPRLSIIGLHVKYSNPMLNPAGTAPTTLAFTVRNTGNELLGGNVSAAVLGLFGTTGGQSNVAKIPVMLPGGSDTATVTVPGVFPEFDMTAKITIKPLVASGQYDPGLTTFPAQVSFWAVPWTLIAIVIAVLAAGTLILVRRRRRTVVALLGSSRRQRSKVVEA
jgi:hypothetical protein